MPLNTLGVDGDFYLNVTNGDVYERTGTYSVVGNIKGDPGGVSTSLSIDHATSHNIAGIPSANDLSYHYALDEGVANAYVADPVPGFTAYDTTVAVTVTIANSNTGAATLNLNGLGAKPIVPPYPRNFLHDIGTANTYIANKAATPFGYLWNLDGYALAIKIAHTNTGAATLNVDGLGALPILMADGVTPISAGTLTGGQVYDFTLDNAATPFFRVVTHTFAALQPSEITAGESYLFVYDGDHFIVAETLPLLQRHGSSTRFGIASGKQNILTTPAFVLGSENVVRTTIDPDGSINDGAVLVLGDNNIIDNRDFDDHGSKAVAVGNNNSISGSGIALGDGNTLVHDLSFAFGENNTASEQSIAFGYGNMLRNQSYAMGRNNKVDSEGIALGNTNTITEQSYAIGNDNTVSNQSIVFGNNNHSKEQSFTIGNYNTVAGQSYAIGGGNTLIEQTYAFGNGNTLSAQGVAFGNGNTLSAAGYAFGSGNQITLNSYQAVCFGNGNTITNSSSALSLGFSKIVNSSQSVSFGGNTITDSSAALAAGYGNSLTDMDQSIVFGNANTLTTTASGGQCFALGNTNTITDSSQGVALGNTNIITDTYNGLVLGNANTITKSNQGVAFGNTNVLTNTQEGFALGNVNTITDSSQGVVFGNESTIVNSQQSLTLGNVNTITDSNQGIIIGNDNSLTTVEPSLIVGNSNTITGSGRSCAFGDGLNISGGNSFVIGGSGDDHGNSGGLIHSGVTTSRTAMIRQTEEYVLYAHVPYFHEFGSDPDYEAPVPLSIDGATEWSGIMIPNNSVALFSIKIVAVQWGSTAASLTWTLTNGVIARGASMATTIMSDDNPPFIPGVTIGPAQLIVPLPTVTADVSHGGFDVRWTPPTGNAAHWNVVAKLEWLITNNDPSE